MVFEHIGSININCTSENLHNAFNNLYLKPNHLNKFAHGSINEKNLSIITDECVVCSIADVVGCKFLLKKDDNKKDGDKDDTETSSKKVKFDDKSDKHIPKITVSPCQECKCENGNVLKQYLTQIIYHWFEDCTASNDIQGNLRKLIPKNTKRFSCTYEWVVQETKDKVISMVVIPICMVNDSVLLVHKSYGFVFKENDQTMYAYVHKRFHMEVPAMSLVASKHWIIESILPKLKKWGEVNLTQQTNQFESLVNMEKYSNLYFHLKEKYATYFINIWPENTDPLKFVYEDVAIATYLLLIWEEERDMKKLSHKQSFLDVGCGNGLLVYILTSEGHPGKGVDIVKRKIWDVYGSSIVLEETSILPNNLKVDVDWVVGNHTDELTPWIPIIAARSSYFVNYFVLPCCFYDFNKKYDGGAANSQSKYRNYLDYIVKIGKDCGFKVEEDILKIPSTKRICSIGRHRTSKEEDQHNIDNVIEDILKENSCFIDLYKDEQINGFQPREVIKDPKNCTQIDQHIKEKMVDMVIKRLLMKENIGYDGDNKVYDGDKVTCSGKKWSEWNAGDCISISECAKLFNESLLKNLKDQSGGLQSLLKNHQRIFKVFNGMVALRDFRNPAELQWGRKGKTKKTNIHKTIGCWFYVCHPQGCVLSAGECRYAHGDEDKQYYHYDK